MKKLILNIFVRFYRISPKKNDITFAVDLAFFSTLTVLYFNLISLYAIAGKLFFKDIYKSKVELFSIIIIAVMSIILFILIRYKRKYNEIIDKYKSDKSINKQKWDKICLLYIALVFCLFIFSLIFIQI